MERKTSKILIWIGLALLVIPLFVIVVMGVRDFPKLFGLSIWFFLIAWWGWNSEERKARKKEIRDLQMEALRQSVRKGKTEVSMVGKMRKLK